MELRQVPTVQPPKPKPVVVTKTNPANPEPSSQQPAQVWRPAVPYYGPWGYQPGYQPAGYWTYQPGPPPQPSNGAPTPSSVPEKAVEKTTKLAEPEATEASRPAKVLSKEEEIGELAGKWITKFLQQNPEMVDAIPPSAIKALKSGNLTPEQLQELFTQLIMQKNGLGSLGKGLQNNWLTNNWVSRKFVMPWAKWGVRQMMPPGTGGLSDKLFDTVVKPS